MKFKVGDRVRIVDRDHPRHGASGYVVGTWFEPVFGVYVQLGGDTDDTWGLYETSVELDELHAAVSSALEAT